MTEEPRTSDDKQPTEEPRPSHKRKWLRLGLVVAMILALVLVGKLTGLTEYLSVKRVQAMMQDAGVLGFVIFVAVFTAGELIQVPGIVFVGAAVLAYGKLLGFVASFIAAVISCTLAFVIVRGVGGKPLGEIKNRWARRILDKLETHPFTVIVVLRLIMWMAPSLNYALAMSNVKMRHYLSASIVGLILPVLGMVLFLDWFLKLLL
jgi:uncharacterized membrane protein YdjX (TVP38/TMEM64 family)